MQKLQKLVANAQSNEGWEVCGGADKEQPPAVRKRGREGAVGERAEGERGSKGGEREQAAEQ